MPGANCCFPQCTNSRYERKTKHQDANDENKIHFFAITCRKGDFYAKWRENTLDVVKRYRKDIDAKFLEQMQKGKKWICSLHYKPVDIETTDGVKILERPRLVPGALPSLNLPVRSHDPPQREQCRTLNIVRENDIKPVYKNLNDLYSRSLNLKSMTSWNVERRDLGVIVFTKDESPYIIPKFQILVNSSFELKCTIYGLVLPDSHEIFNTFTLHSDHIQDVLTSIDQYQICIGNPQETSTTKAHIVPVSHDIEGTSQHKHTDRIYHRNQRCELMINASESPQNICKECQKGIIDDQRKINRQIKKSNIPAKKYAPTSKTDPKRVILGLEQKCKGLQSDIERLQQEIRDNGVSLDNEISSDFEQIMKNAGEDVTPFMRMFWDEQTKLRDANPHARKYHPMLIRFCLSLHAKSATAYEELRSSNILTLPSQRTLRDYRNAIRPTPGFDPEVVQQLRESARGYAGYQRYTIISFDEMKIQDNLVYDKSTGELIGFVDLGDPVLNYGSFDDRNVLASNVLVFYVRGLASKLKFPLCYITTSGAKAFQILPVFWEAVAILELTCELPVIAAVCDGATPNRKFFRIHEFLSDQLDSDITYRTRNLFAINFRYIYFFSDAPHLMKTTRNCLYHSGNGKSRLMRNNGHYLIWKHIRMIVDNDMKCQLHLLHKLTPEHINLTSYSVMNVRLATQVLSRSVGQILNTYYGDQGTQETANLCLMMNTFFDCLNVRSFTEYITTKNPNVAPYENPSDRRLDWLANDFLNYLESWKSYTESHAGVTDDHEKMFLSKPTYEGLRITARSTVECTRYLLHAGVPKVLTNRYLQDICEEHFGKHRGLWGRNENPSVHQFGYQENLLRCQETAMRYTGNTSGAHAQKTYNPWSEVLNEPLKKRKKSRKNPKNKEQSLQETDEDVHFTVG